MQSAVASPGPEVTTPARQLMNAVLAKPPSPQSWGLGGRPARAGCRRRRRQKRQQLVMTDGCSGSGSPLRAAMHDVTESSRRPVRSAHLPGSLTGEDAGAGGVRSLPEVMPATRSLSCLTHPHPLGAAPSPRRDTSLRSGATGGSPKRRFTQEENKRHKGEERDGRQTDSSRHDGPGCWAWEGSPASARRGLDA